MTLKECEEVLGIRTRSYILFYLPSLFFFEKLIKVVDNMTSLMVSLSTDVEGMSINVEQFVLIKDTGRPFRPVLQPS